MIKSLPAAHNTASAAKLVIFFDITKSAAHKCIKIFYLRFSAAFRVPAWMSRPIWSRGRWRGQVPRACRIHLPRGVSHRRRRADCRGTVPRSIGVQADGRSRRPSRRWLRVRSRFRPQVPARAVAAASAVRPHPPTVRHRLRPPTRRPGAGGSARGRCRGDVPAGCGAVEGGA